MPNPQGFQLDPNDSTNAVCIFQDEKVRTIYTNNLPNHSYGTWPSGNPVSAQELTFYECAFPQKAAQTSSIYDAGDFQRCTQYIEYGVSINGIRMAPFGARWFVNPNTQEENTDWNIEALVLFDMDFNNSHSNGSGEYHYHGIPIQYFTDSLNIDGTKHSPLVGYAADGFPIYYKYAYTNGNGPNSGISAFSSGHTLKTGNRPGDGILAPNGPYDGLYIEDYEFTRSNWELDECNGRFGITPEYPNGSYYYLMTDNWPYIPRCFHGSVIDNSFRIGPRCPASEAEMECMEQEPNSINELRELSINISPNPSSSFLHIDDLSIDEQINVLQTSIYDLNGKIWYSMEGFVDRIDITKLKPGNYFVQINHKKAQVTRKIIVE